MIPSWYDVLGVDDDATTDEIRAAWQEAVAGLDPTDRRFKQRNRAAEVLLDPARRATHDRELAAQDDDEDQDDWTDGPAVVPPAVTDRADAPTGESAEAVRSSKVEATAPGATDDTDDTDDTDHPLAAGTPAVVSLDKHEPKDAPAVEPSAPRAGRVRLVLGLGVLALVLVLATLVSLVAGGGSDDSTATDGLPDARQVDAARKAAEAAAGPVLSYDYRDLDKSFAAAKSFMTPHYQGVYDQNVAGYVEENAPTTKTIVTAEVVSSGVVRTGKDRVDVLVFVNRPTRNASRDEVSRDQVTVRMLDVDDSWLVDCLITAPGGTC